VEGVGGRVVDVVMGIDDAWWERERGARAESARGRWAMTRQTDEQARTAGEQHNA